jgi:hypothetical protein
MNYRTKMIIQAAKDSGYVVIISDEVGNMVDLLVFAGSLDDCLTYVRQAMQRKDDQGT